MAEYMQGPVVLVALDVEEERRVRGPHDAAAGLLQDVGQVFAALPVAHADGEVFRTTLVSAPGDHSMIRRMARLAKVKIIRHGGERIAIEHDLHLASV